LKWIVKVKDLINALTRILVHSTRKMISDHERHINSTKNTRVYEMPYVCFIFYNEQVNKHGNEHRCVHEKILTVEHTA
jgi:hypothetical protein